MTMTVREIEDDAIGTLQMWMEGYTDGEEHGHQHRLVLLANSPEDEPNDVTFQVQDTDRTPVSAFVLTVSAKRIPL